MIFRDYRKDDLTALAKLHNLSGYTKFKKAELIDFLAHSLLDKDVMCRYFTFLSDEELVLIEKFSNDSNYMEASEEEIGNAMALLEGGYAGCHDFDDIVIPKEVAEAYKKNCGGEWHRLRREALELSYYLNGAAELYGICPMEKALELYRKYTGKNVDEITMYGFCESIPENRKNYHYNGMELVHKFFDKEEKRETLVKLQQGKEFYMPTKKEVLTLGKDGYFPFDDSMRNLESFLNIFLGEVPGFAANLCRHIQYQIRTGAEISEIMEFLEENEILEEISDREAFRSFEQLLAKVWSRTRKMSDRGTLPKGLIRQERMRAEEGRFAKADVVPFPVDLNRKIYPNDPCPCGSGKKYKKCCGRNK